MIIASHSVPRAARSSRLVRVSGAHKAGFLRFACRRLGALLVAALLIASTVPLGAADADADRIALAVEALTRLEGLDLNANPALKGRILQVLEKTRGTPSFVKLVQHFKLPDQHAGLLEVAAAQPSGESGVEAMRLVLGSGGAALVRQALEGTNALVATKIAEAIGNTGDKQSVA